MRGRRFVNFFNTARVPAFVPAGAVSYADFSGNRGWTPAGGVTDAASQITVSRASVGTVYNTDGSISTVANNVARLSASEVLPEAAGLLVEKSILNGPGAIDFTSAVLGVIGAGGALPTGVTNAQDDSGLVKTIVAKDANGFTIRYSGVGAGAGLIQLALGRTAIAGGPTVTMSFSAQLVAGSWANIGTGSGAAFISVEQFNGGGGFQDRNLLGSFAGDHAVSNQYFNTDRPWVVEYRNATTNALSATASPGFVAIVGTGAIDATFRFERPQLELGAVRTTFQPAATRAADDVTGKNTASLFAAAPWSVSVTADVPRESDTGTLWQVDDGTAANYVSLYLANYQLKLKIVSANATLADAVVATLPAMARFSVSLGVSGVGYSISTNGKPAKTAALTPPAGLTSEKIGSGQAGYWNGFIQNRAIYPSAMSGAQIAAASIPAGVFFDDFDRANGAPGTAPTGQPWQQIPNNGAGIVLAPITGNRLVPPDSGFASTASYSGYDMGAGALPKIMAASVIFSAGAAIFGGNLISNPAGINSVTDITTKSNHAEIGPGTFSWSVFESAVATTVDQSNSRTALSLDNATRYQIARINAPGGVEIHRTPTGELQRYVDNRFSADLGRYNIWETFAGTGSTFMGYAAVGAK